MVAALVFFLANGPAGFPPIVGPVLGELPIARRLPNSEGDVERPRGALGTSRECRTGLAAGGDDDCSGIRFGVHSGESGGVLGPLGETEQKHARMIERLVVIFLQNLA